MVLASFHVENYYEKAWFFQETFLLTDTSRKMVLGMLFLTLKNASISFLE